MVSNEDPTGLGRREVVYLAVLCAVFAGLALLRPELVAGAFRATSASLKAGWGPALKVLAEILLFAGILFLTLRTVPRGAAPAEDGFIVLFAALYGYLAEAWGTRSGLWTYYTGEKPPLWIIPAWCMGALVIHRLSRQVMKFLMEFAGHARTGRLHRAWIIVFCCVFISFSAEHILTPAGISLALLLALALLPLRTRPQNDAAVLFTGTICVIFADLWGTTNNCWTYHVRGRAHGLIYGIAFGALFDSALVLAAIKTAGAVRTRLRGD